MRLRAGTFQEEVVIALETDASLTVIGGWNAAFETRSSDPSSTVVDGGDSVRPITITASSGLIAIDTLRLTNGRSQTSGGGLNARLNGTSAVELVNVLIDNNLVVGTNSIDGGGLSVTALDDSSFHLESSTVASNVVGVEPNNPAGGGLSIFSHGRARIRIVDNVVVNNRLMDDGQNTGSGGFLNSFGESSLIFSDNFVQGNQCTGNACIGALTIWLFESAAADVRRNVLTENSKADGGFGPQASLSASEASQMFFTDSLVVASNSSGIQADSSGAGQMFVLNSTIAANDAGGLIARIHDPDAQVTVGNTILWNNGDANAHFIEPEVFVSNNLIGIDPLFANAAESDYRILANSPARNAGSTDFSGLGTLDADGKPRVLGAGIDIGAYEFDEAPPTPCASNDQTLCLLGGRFEVQVTWQDFNEGFGQGVAVPSSRILRPSDDSGLFYFFERDNWEVLVKVIDACDFNQHFWVYGAATTNVGYELTVRDTQTGTVSRYSNPLGQRSPAITDTAAFATCQ